MHAKNEDTGRRDEIEHVSQNVQKRGGRIAVRVLALFWILAMLQAKVVGAQTEPPDLMPCFNDGWQSLTGNAGAPFTSEAECLDYAALGGSFNPPNVSEADFFVTNLTGKPLQLGYIEVVDSTYVSSVTRGWPADWPGTTLPIPWAKPNWPDKTTLKLRFGYEPFFGSFTNVKWLLYISDFKRLYIEVNWRDAPGWDVNCGIVTPPIETLCKWSGDGVHMTLVPKPKKGTGQN